MVAGRPDKHRLSLRHDQQAELQGVLADTRHGLGASGRIVHHALGHLAMG